MRYPLVSKSGEHPTPGSRYYSHNPLKLSVQLLFGGCGLPVIAAASTTTYSPFQLPELSSFLVSLATATNLHMPPPKLSVLHSFLQLYASLATPTNHPHNRSQPPKTSVNACCVSLAAATNDTPITTEIERTCSFLAVGGSPWRPTTPQPPNQAFMLVSGGCGLSLATHTSTPTDPQLPPPRNLAFALDFRAGATSQTAKSSTYGLDFAVCNMAPFFDVLCR